MTAASSVFPTLNSMSGLDCVPVVFFLRQPTQERSTRWHDELGSLVPMVHELIDKFADLSWTLRPGPQFFRGSPGDPHGYRNAIRARFAPRPVSFTTALLGRVGHAQKLA